MTTPGPRTDTRVSPPVPTDRGGSDEDRVRRTTDRRNGPAPSARLLRTARWDANGASPNTADIFGPGDRTLLAIRGSYHVIQACDEVGSVLAAVIVAEIGDIHRSKGPGQLSRKPLSWWFRS
ncbi:hypothetical protein GCM10009850_006480 [Nonomuraea monospora]|uniref:Uncharacterized protein n=1 Tax=Nonomuraea monospora TaxID=568818 RepID=A0ABP5P3P6_9ACTN